MGVSTERALGAALVERVRSGGSGVTAGELSVIRREWEGEGRPAPERHVHRSAVVFDDGTAVTAVSFFADDPYSREVLRRSGCTWTRDGPRPGRTVTWTGPTSVYRRTGTRCVLRSSISLTEPGGVSQWRWGAWVAWSNRDGGRVPRRVDRNAGRRSGCVGKGQLLQEGVETDEQEALVRNFLS